MPNCTGIVRTRQITSPNHKPGMIGSCMLPRSSAGMNIGKNMLIKKTGIANASEVLNARYHSWISFELSVIVVGICDEGIVSGVFYRFNDRS